MIEQLLGAREISRWGSGGFHDLDLLTTRKSEELLKKDPALRLLVERCRARVLETEVTRGDTPTPASGPALSLSTVHGIPNLVAILRALGNRNFTRGYARDNDSKETVFSGYRGRTTTSGLASSACFRFEASRSIMGRFSSPKTGSYSYSSRNTGRMAHDGQAVLWRTINT